jgi:hypothetical protein
MRRKSPEQALATFAGAPSNLDLSRWTGRRRPEATRGEARAALAAELRQIREGGLYRRTAANWTEFCESNLRIDRRSIDRGLRQLRDFGPAFFHVADAWPLSTKEYRGIQEHVRPEGVVLDGAVVPFGENSRRGLAGAISELLQRRKTQARLSPNAYRRVYARLERATGRLERVDIALDRLQKIELSTLLGRLLRRGVELGVRAA